MFASILIIAFVSIGVLLVVAVGFKEKKEVRDENFRKNCEQIDRVLINLPDERYHQRRIEYGDQSFADQNYRVGILPCVGIEADPSIFFHPHPTRKTIFCRGKVWHKLKLDGALISQSTAGKIVNDLIESIELVEDDPALVTKQKLRTLNIIGVPIVLLIWLILVVFIFVIPEIQRKQNDGSEYPKHRLGKLFSTPILE